MLWFSMAAFGLYGRTCVPLLCGLMIYSLELRSAFFVIGLLLMVAGLLTLARLGPVGEGLRRFPRSRSMGIGLCIAAAVWAWWLVWTIDLGEFSNWRPRILILIPVAALLTMVFVEEFLAVRSLGMLVLLGAEPLLEAAWMRPEGSRLFLVSLVYVGITLSLFWIGMPYVLRDQIGWIIARQARLRVLAGAFSAYGLLLVLSALQLVR